jgi:hypothetical protein
MATDQSAAQACCIRLGALNAAVKPAIFWINFLRSVTVIVLIK